MKNDIRSNSRSDGSGVDIKSSQAVRMSGGDKVSNFRSLVVIG